MTGREHLRYSGTRHLCLCRLEENNVFCSEKIVMYHKDTIPFHLVLYAITASLPDSNNVRVHTKTMYHLTTGHRKGSPGITFSVEGTIAVLRHPPFPGQIDSCQIRCPEVSSAADHYPLHLLHGLTHIFLICQRTTSHRLLNISVDNVPRHPFQQFC